MLTLIQKKSISIHMKVRLRFKRALTGLKRHNKKRIQLKYRAKNSKTIAAFSDQ